MMKRAIGYVRVSSDEQAERGISLAAQRRKIQAYCELHDLELAEVVEDAGVSGKSLARPGIQRVLELARRNGTDAVVIVKLDRLSRSTIDTLRLIETTFGQKSPVELHSIGDKLDTGSAAGRFVIAILASLAQMEREQVGERTAAVLSHKRARGQKTGGFVPYGYRLAVDGQTLEPEPSEQERIALIAQLRADGLSYRRLASELTDRGIYTRKGTAWTATQVHRIVSRNGRPYPAMATTAAA